MPTHSVVLLRSPADTSNLFGFIVALSGAILSLAMLAVFT